MQKIDHDKFIAACGKFNDSQRQGMDALLTFLEADAAMDDIRWCAYALATISRECAGTWQPIAEYGKGKGMKYGNPDPITGKVYYGRGFVQLTWPGNYKAMSKVVGVDLYQDPDSAMIPEIAYKIMSYGMRNGSFTGASLKSKIHDDVCDYFNARRIINGTDHAQEIADAAKWFEETLKDCIINV